MGGQAEVRRSHDSPSLRKERGAFFTPPTIARFLVEWAVRGAADRVMEPSCGEAAFLVPAADRLRDLGATGPDQLHGVEVHAASAAEARRLVAAHGLPAAIQAADFFDVDPDATFDAVVGNPPYIRYQQFAGDLRAKALRAAFTQGVKLTQLASSWAAFVVQATRFLKPGGRLGLVLPAELLTVNYAAPVRRFLLRRFKKVRLVMFEELVFPGVLEEVVLLMAEGEGSAECFEVFQARDVADLAAVERKVWSWFAPEKEGKWTGALLPADAFAEYRAIVEGPAFSPMVAWGETSLGAVTGNNKYFTLTRDQVRELRIPQGDLLPISPPGSRHLRGLTFTDKAWAQASSEGSACHLFYPANRLSVAATRYIEQGEAAKVHHAYKCEVRDPWWRVPVVPVPDLLLTYMDQHRPRLITNAAKVAHLNSLYGVTLRPDVRQLGRDLLPIASLNSVTLLGAEVVGRSYGGGLLKLEPKEADVMPVPSAERVGKVADDLRALRPQLAKHMRGGKLADAAALVDAVVLPELSPKKLATLREARELLYERRTTRGKGLRGTS